MVMSVVYGDYTTKEKMKVVDDETEEYVVEEEDCSESFEYGFQGA